MKSQRQGWVTDPLTTKRLGTVALRLRDEASRFGVPVEIFDQLVSERSKRLRPAFVLLAGRMSGGCEEELIDAATGIELVHEGTLYHDDIVDRAVVRRGQRTAVAAHGPRAAAAAGSAMIYRGMELALGLPAPVRRDMAATADAMARAVVREVETTGDASVSVGLRSQIMFGKTARLFDLAVRTGLALGTADRAGARALRRFAVRFAMAFQLADDLHDFAGTVAPDRDKPGVDLKTGIFTLPVLAALRGPDAAQTARLRSLLSGMKGNMGVAELGEIQTLVEAGGGLDWASEKLAHWVSCAAAELHTLREVEPRMVSDSLANLLDRLAEISALDRSADAAAYRFSDPGTESSLGGGAG